MTDQIDDVKWAKTDPRYIFVQGAKWWEWVSSKATMWSSDRAKAEAEAERRYPEPTPDGPLLLTHLTQDDFDKFHAAHLTYSGSTGPRHQNHSVGPYIATYVSVLPAAILALGWDRVVMEMRAGQLVARREGRTSRPGQIVAPWTAKQVVALNRWQWRDDVHPFTCAKASCQQKLVATRDGWVCLNCGYTQDWAHGFMAAAADTQEDDQLVALAIQFHRKIEGEYGCPGETCPGVQRLIQWFHAIKGLGRDDEVAPAPEQPWNERDHP